MPIYNRMLRADELLHDLLVIGKKLRSETYSSEDMERDLMKFRGKYGVGLTPEKIMDLLRAYGSNMTYVQMPGDRFYIHLYGLWRVRDPIDGKTYYVLTSETRKGEEEWLFSLYTFTDKEEAIETLMDMIRSRIKD